MRNRLHAYVSLAVLITEPVTHANSPLPPRPLAERVKMSTHIFVGKIRDVYFVSTSGKKISPLQVAQQLSKVDLRIRSPLPFIETKIEVKERLLWRTGKPEPVILFREEVPMGYYRLHDQELGMKQILSMRKKDVGKNFVFLTDIVAQQDHTTYFTSSYGYYYREKMTKKTAVQRAVKQLQNQ